ncbi:hypothetical protein U9M48_036096 [Paspalum notatum var. saurae]|uniref:Integrase zinc-binding domain-containing protein n=1 Tax=Paspalum notatum var. saurae TaxID=547442 RepID=A0AAQ3UDD8_PASNO
MVAEAMSRRNANDPSILVVLSPNFDIMHDLWMAPTTDLAILALGEQTEPWAVVDGLVTYNRQLYIPQSSHLLSSTIAIVHDASHEGMEKTLQRFRHNFHTPRAHSVIQDVVRHGSTSQQNKTEHLSTAG